MNAPLSHARTASVVFLAILACLAAAQEWTSQGSITSRRYQNQIREGGQIVATEFFTLEYSVDTWIEETGGMGGPHLICRNRCNGKIHAKHEDCDFSCDERCTEEHKTTVKGEYYPRRDAMNQATRDANGLANQGGGSHSPSDWSHRVSTALAAFRRETKKKKTFEMPHAEACSSRNWWVGTKTFLFHVRGTMTKVGYRMSRGVRTPINETVGTHEAVVAQGNIVQEEPLETHEWTSCGCRGKDEPPASYQSIMEDLDKILEGLNGLLQEEKEATSVGTSGILMTNMAGEPVDPGESKVTVKPNDMNSCAVEIENGTGQDVNVIIPVGTFFDAVDSGTQDMSSSVRATGVLYSGQKLTLYVSLRPQQRQTTAAFPFRWTCLNMAKKAPTASSRFAMRPPQDDVLVRLGALTNNSLVRGPHDQVRTWIYTDNASYEEVNKRLFPGVTEGRYATLLWEVATVGGVDVTAREYRDCLDPKLLNGVPLDDRATAWLVGVLTEIKARDLARYVDANAAQLAQLMNTSPEFAPGHVATLATAMLEQDNTDVRRAGIKLTASVPSGLRQSFVQSGGLAGLRNALASGNASEAGAALDALMAYPKDAASDLLGASWEQLPTDALKEKARRHLGIE